VGKEKRNENISCSEEVKEGLEESRLTELHPRIQRVSYFRGALSDKQCIRRRPEKKKRRGVEARLRSA